MLNLLSRDVIRTISFSCFRGGKTDFQLFHGLRSSAIRVSAVISMVEFDLMSHLPIFSVQEKLGCNLIGSDFGQLHMCSRVSVELMDCRPCFLAVFGHIG